MGLLKKRNKVQGTPFIVGNSQFTWSCDEELRKAYEHYCDDKGFKIRTFLINICNDGFAKLGIPSFSKLRDLVSDNKDLKSIVYEYLFSKDIDNFSRWLSKEVREFLKNDPEEYL